MIPINIAKNFSNTVTATSGAVMLVAAMCIGSGPALADGKTNHLSQLTTVKNVDHNHRRFRHRLVSIGYGDADPECRYQRTIDGLVEICPAPHSVFSAGQYIGRDPDARIRGQILNDFDRGATFPGGR